MSTAHLTLLLGGVRSGKSARAVALAARTSAGRVLFVATAQAHDGEMARRIAAHRRERPGHWDTLESPLKLAADVDRALAGAPIPYGVIVIDCLTLWVSNVLLSLDERDDAEAVIAARTQLLLEVCARHAAATRWVIVSNEVGLGVVPPTSLGRRYRDALGRANQVVAAAAQEVVLLVAGIALPLKGAPP